MKPSTAELWELQNKHPGDRERLFDGIRPVVGDGKVLYPGCFVDIAPSFVFTDVTYVDVDRRARAFFADSAGVAEIVASRKGSPGAPEIRFIAGDYTRELGLGVGTFDLLVSLYGGLVSDHCTKYLRVGGMLLANPSHGDVAMASVDSRYRLSAVVVRRGGGYRVSAKALETFLVPKSPVEITAEAIRRTGRGVGYTRSPYAYLFERVS